MGKIVRTPAMNIKLVLGKQIEWESLLAMALLVQQTSGPSLTAVQPLAKMITDFYRNEGTPGMPDEIVQPPQPQPLAADDNDEL